MIKHFPLLALTALVLTGCQTLKGIQQDFGAISTTVTEKASAITAPDGPPNNTCPPIVIDPQLDSASDFSDMENPSDANNVSHIYLTRTASECSVVDGFMEARIDLVFEGKLGPKARRKEGDRPYFAYPYFIAVTDSAGNELARELFAASVTYEADQNAVELVETIRQKLPLNKNGRMPAYQIHIGFQLTEEQLFYNASL